MHSKSYVLPNVLQSIKNLQNKNSVQFFEELQEHLSSSSNLSSSIVNLNCNFQNELSIKIHELKKMERKVVKINGYFEYIQKNFHVLELNNERLVQGLRRGRL
ncbi:Hypothetical_protein [Hexamita inflata]|uniref:Hypothetical_protein n=1 Tax=Hexamita inflata TaxID=28002 RepID=A0AA86UVL9_9EUKA|nr:Hypothetical protein HINF_LOCUS44212 [Hexamita inflata]CAI9966612.1 Hypothetical protein HINF_LOCUS54257 [Hexamita inflata]